MTTEKDSKSWDFGRFVKTLAYFGVVPLLSNLDWFQQLLGSKTNPKLDTQKIMNGDRLTENSLNLTLFDFRHSAQDLQNIWGAVDDVVMGGVSQSDIKISDGKAIFSGNVSSANSGGFASVRTRNFDPPMNLAGYDGIELNIKGDGLRYKFLVRSESRWDGIGYSFSFDTDADKWMKIRIPFTNMIPVFRAKVVPDAHLNSSQIHAIQLMLSKFEYDGGLNPHFKAGNFQLQIDSITAYRN
ncbi:NADH:ubiquinone oxidoreductase intermediate-associated protein 30 domain-containing protein [Tumidithrix helvetica PCC 7403]|uniref:CIA30 family protein n=1 Tax=Tumidithrix helvetica TaxID=3457545 RepID=UPI003CC0F9C3